MAGAMSSTVSPGPASARLFRENLAEATFGPQGRGAKTKGPCSPSIARRYTEDIPSILSEDGKPLESQCWS